MSKNRMISMLSVLSILMCVAVGATGVASAAPSEKAVTRVAAAQARLDAAKLAICQNRQMNINTAFGRIAARNKAQLDFLSTLATRAQSYYTKSGKTITNYNDLVADITTKQAAAQTAVNAEAAIVDTFTCTSEDPHGNIQTFQNDHKASITALHDYRASIRTLLVAIKAAVEAQ